MAAKLTDEERAKIVRYLKDEKTQGWIAREVGRGKATVSRVAAEEGVATERSKTKNASQAHRAYAEERRLEIIGKGFDKADNILAALKDPRDFQAWTVGFGTLIDKARLELGDVTNRTENRNISGDDLEGYFGELDRALESFGDSHSTANPEQSVDNTETY